MVQLVKGAMAILNPFHGELSSRELSFPNRIVIVGHFLAIDHLIFLHLNLKRTDWTCDIIAIASHILLARFKQTHPVLTYSNYDIIYIYIFV